MKVKKPLIVVALKQEADDLLVNHDLDVIYSGVGKINATYCLTKELAQRKIDNCLPDIVINYGTAGSAFLEKGAIYVVDKFIQRDMDVTPLGFDLSVTPFEEYPQQLTFSNNLDSALVCATGDNFEIKKLNLGYDLVDMESYALAKVCFFEKINFLSVKYISDNANQSAASDWKSNVSLGENLFLNWYKSYFK